MELLDGRQVADEILEKVTGEVRALTDQSIQPKLAVILVGKHPASLAYVGQKKKAAEKTGIIYEQIDLPESTTTEELIATVEKLNADDTVHGILVQLSLPDHVEEPLVIRAVEPKKDVDGFHAYNIGKMVLSTEFESLVPCTPKGVIRLLEHYDISLEGKEVVVVGHSNIVGKPMSIMLLNRNATVTTCHVHTQDLKAHTSRADILVVDVGINRVDGKMVGDVDFDAASQKTSYITPVPGGVGPMTVACLMENVTEAARRLGEISNS